MNLQPISLREARHFVNLHHRHHKAPRGGKYAIGLNDDNEVMGVAIVGRPVARMSDDGWTAEVIRLCVTEGHKNAASMLYQACWRAARAMGYRRLITYTLQSEPGTSLRAAGWRLIGEAGGGTWDRKQRPRVDTHPTEQKLLWERAT
ncbi:hypothetical protein LCGC14_1618610 [marine sediment metagenome]|uniref:N-acetyltransferase domain-containing protein n=1 Tax=marine sediment metagenome TaxID=412755 RepID=A0A0F9KLT2_9ZZZZ